MLVLAACVALCAGVLWQKLMLLNIAAIPLFPLIVASLIRGTALAGIWFAIKSRRKGAPCASTPGEWLWLAFGIVVAAQILLLLPLVSSLADIEWLFNALVFAVAARKLQGVIAWRISMLLIAGLHCWAGVGPTLAIPSCLLPAIGRTIGAAAVLTTLAAVCLEWRQHVRRGWQHWVGVIICLVAVLVGVLGVF